VPRPTSALITGVRNPKISSAPATAAPAPTNDAQTPPRSPKYKLPCTTDVTPSAVRSSRRPTPGHPTGNVEKRRCSLFSLSQCVSRHLLEDNRAVPSGESPNVGAHF
jgi:hypothetical protein